MNDTLVERPRRRCRVLQVRPGRRLDSHEAVAHRQLAARLATFLGEPVVDAAQRPDGTEGASYFVPDDTLLESQASPLGITGPNDLFGGVVPHAHVAAKTIVHPIAQAATAAPYGWRADFAQRLSALVLPGCSAFCHDDAMAAGAALLRDGSVRLKKADGIGGLGQAVASDARQLEALLDAMGADGAWEAGGLVLERNLVRVVTHSVGQVCVRGLLLSYCGLQRSTINHHGHQVYGGSRLEVVRGDYECLSGLNLAPDAGLAVQQARAFHRSAFECFKGLIVSRANYDIAQGLDDAGRWCSGVIEQSWRIGGASGAEITALEAFDANPDARVVIASTIEEYDEKTVPPAHAVLHFQGIDDDVGGITTFSTLDEVRT
jgi:hypothetical protein